MNMCIFITKKLKNILNRNSSANISAKTEVFLVLFYIK